jgi:acetyl/propionyl-CoA carboxylase alpha subunit
MHVFCNYCNHCTAAADDASGTVLKGVPNNVEFLRRLVTDPRFIAGDTTTKFLEDFNFTPRVAEIILPGEQRLGVAMRQQVLTGELFGS